MTKYNVVLKRGFNAKVETVESHSKGQAKNWAEAANPGWRAIEVVEA